MLEAQCFYWAVPVFVKLFNIFEYACFRNDVSKGNHL